MRRHALTALAFPLVSALVASALVPSHAAANASVKVPAPVAGRYVAILHEGVSRCPSVKGWKQSPIFDPLRVNTRIPQRQVPQDKGRNNPTGPKHQVPKDKAPLPSFDFTPFRRFCQYTRKEPPDAKSASLSLKDSAEFLRVDPDYDALVPQGPLGQDPTVQDALNQTFRAMLDLGLPNGKVQPLYFPKDPNSRSVAQVAVIDTADGARDSRRGARHGRAMAEIIHEVRCPAREPDCQKHLTFHNAFPRAAVPGSTSEPLGSLGSLAEEIYLAVSSWRWTNAINQTDAPLILNLSLGWDPGVWNEEATDGESPAWAPADWDLGPWDIPTNQGDERLRLRQEWPATTQAVHAALLYASCFDVLVLAAAGNNTRGAEVQTGALAPAKWEKLLAPDKETCMTLFGGAAERTGNDKIKIERKALVYGVRGRMTGVGNSLPNSRKGSTSLQISPASYVVARVGENCRSKARGGNNCGFTDPWSGSSVATAIYSGLAATLWSYDRTLTPHQIMKLIHDTGQGTTVLHPDKMSIKFNPVSLLGSKVETATTEDRATSPDPFKAFNQLCPNGCGYLNPYTDFPQAKEYLWYRPLKAAIEGWITQQTTMDSAPTSQVLMNSHVVDGRTHYYPDNGQTPPHAENVSAKPWTRPQPQTPICSVCVVSDIQQSPTLILSLNEVDELKQSDKVVLEDPVLEFSLPGGFVAVSLGTLEVPPQGLKVPLDRYKIAENGETLGYAIKNSNAVGGTLTIFLKDIETDEKRANVSVVQVMQDWEPR